jgi:uncharacterized protein (DUF58 family)
MQTWPDNDRWREMHAAARAAAAHFRLPFHRQTWRGSAGNWMGAGTGSSIDFQDHRPYLPGDDPRYIDWQAYARTGNYLMKLYREEVSPRLDLVLDASASMFLSPEKQARSLELFYFCVESAGRAGASLRTYLIRGGDIKILPTEAVQTHTFPNFQSLENSGAKNSRDWKSSVPEFPALNKIPFRPGSMRVCVSDLLFPGEPENFLRPLTSSRGRGLVFVPYERAEAEPDWDGNFEFIDCETLAPRIQRVEAALLTRYAESYRRHFDLWRDAARRSSVTLSRVPAAASLTESLRRHALPEGAAEVTN